jgi:hypothetical protein
MELEAGSMISAMERCGSMSLTRCFIITWPHNWIMSHVEEGGWTPTDSGYQMRGCLPIHVMWCAGHTLFGYIIINLSNLAVHFASSSLVSSVVALSPGASFFLIEEIWPPSLLVPLHHQSFVQPLHTGRL